MKIYIENLEPGFTDESLQQLFTPFGEVQSAEIIKDVFTGVSRGFGYVEMKEDTAAQAAIAQLNKSKVQELVITVREAVEKTAQKGSYKVGSGAVNVYRFRKN